MRYSNSTNGFSVASIASSKSDLYSIQNDGKTIHVYDADLIRLLSQVFRVPYKILLPSDGEYGARLPHGNWTGLMGMVHRSEVDLAVGGIALTETRMQDVNFSYPYLISDYTFMTDKPKPTSVTLTLLHAFSQILWILIIAVILVLSCVLFLHVHKTQTYQNVLFMLFGNLLEKSIEIQLRKLSLKLIISAWLIFTFVITNSYKAVLLSILTSPTLTGIKNIPDLAKAAKQNCIACYSYKGNILTQIFLKSEFDAWRSIGKCMQRNVITSEDAESVFVKATPNKAFISDRKYQIPYKEMFFISEDSFSNSMTAFPISKQFSYTKYLNRVIHQLFGTGIFQKIEKDEQFLLQLKAIDSNSSEPGTLKILELKDLKGAFILLLCGYAISIFVLFIEMTVKHYFPKSDVTLFLKRSRKRLKKV